MMDAVEILWEDEEKKKRERERTVQVITHFLYEAAMRPPYLPANWSCVTSEAVGADSFVEASFPSAGQ